MVTTTVARSQSNFFFSTSKSGPVVTNRARQRGIRLYPFSDFHVDSRPAATTLLLGFGGLTGSEIEQGIAELARLC